MIFADKLAGKEITQIVKLDEITNLSVETKNHMRSQGTLKPRIYKVFLLVK